MKVMTLTMLGKLRVVMFGNRRWVGTLVISRRGRVETSLYAGGRKRSKTWRHSRSRSLEGRTHGHPADHGAEVIMDEVLERRRAREEGL